ncbi:hypothetical protein M2T57_30240 [Klebsiella pneumoniae]|nr:hypothetical protein [Klebsiella pneumoniae]
MDVILQEVWEDESWR